MRGQIAYEANELYLRITKTTARKMFAKGKRVVLVPCNFRPFGPFGSSMPLDYAQYEGSCEQTYKHKSASEFFDLSCTAFAQYNCSHEAGYYPAFYVRFADFKEVNP